jgi:sarcosine oxidase subunit alpha
MPWAIAKSKPFFVGQRSIEIQNAKGVARKLVGFTLSDASADPPEECHLVVRGPEIVGRVTSAVRSPSLGKVVGLAYVAPDQAEAGKTFDIKVAGGRLLRANVIPIPFYDPENKRQEM